MKIIRGKLREDTNRDLYYIRIVFLSDDESKKTQLLVCSSLEYLEDFFQIKDGDHLSEDNKDAWLNSVVEKWSTMGDQIFEREVYYDVYANTAEGKENGLEFLKKI